MTADGPQWRSSRNSHITSSGVLEFDGSRRASRGFFSLFSANKAQQPSSTRAMKPHPKRQTLPPSQSLADRFDRISLASPTQLADPAFSRVAHSGYEQMEPILRRDVIRTSAPQSTYDSPGLVAPAPTTVTKPVSQEPRFTAAYYTGSAYASSSSVTLPNESSGSSFTTPSSSSSGISRLPTPVGMPSMPDGLPVVVVSPVAGHFDGGNRPLSPPPEYELEYEMPPRPSPSRNDSAPELRRVEPAGPTRRSQTAPPPPTQSRRHPYDLDRIDELDESSPLGLALHHEGPFQAIASMLKTPPETQSKRPARAPKPTEGSSCMSFSPGQVMPRNFPYYQPALRPDGPSHASTPSAPPQLLAHAPPGAQQHHSQDQRLPQGYQSPAQAPYGAAAPYLPHARYDPVGEPQSLQNGNIYFDVIPEPSGHHVSYSSDDYSAAYGGIVEDEPPPKWDRRNVPPAPTTSQIQMDPRHASQNDGPNGLQLRRHTAQAAFAPPLDPRQNPYSFGQPAPGSLDPRVLQNRDPNLSNSPFDVNPPQQLSHPRPDGAGPPVLGGHARPSEHDRTKRPMSHQPQPAHQRNLTAYSSQPPLAEHDSRRRASQPAAPPGEFSGQTYEPQQQQQQTVPLPKHDPRKHASQLPPATVPPADFGRQLYEQQPQPASLLDRPQTIAPSLATSTARRGPLPHHIPKNLVMPTPLQQSSPLSNHSATQSHPAEHYSAGQQHQVRFKTPPSQSQPTRAQTIQMVQDRDGGRHLLRKRSSVQTAPPVMPSKPPPRPMSYMEPPPTIPGQPAPKPAQQEKKRTRRLLSKRRTDL